jgi:hypothetical protein
LVVTPDKKEVIMGTSTGQIILLSILDFTVIALATTRIKNKVTEISCQDNKFVVGYSNGQIVLYRRIDPDSPYTTTKLKKNDDETVIGLKFSRYSQHLVAVKPCKDDEKNEKYHLILFDLKEDTAEGFNEAGQVHLFW